MVTRIVLTAILAMAVTGCSESPEASTDLAASSAAESQPNGAGDSGVVATGSVDSEFHGPREIVVEGRLTVDVMENALPLLATELAARMQVAIAKNPQWWAEHVKKAQPGEPLPYDPRIGVTESEYKEFLTLSKKMTLQKTTEATLAISRKGDDVYILDGGPVLPGEIIRPQCTYQLTLAQDRDPITDL